MTKMTIVNIAALLILSICGRAPACNGSSPSGAENPAPLVSVEMFARNDKVVRHQANETFFAKN